MGTFCLKVSPIGLSSGGEDAQALTRDVIVCICHFYVKIVNIPSYIIKIKIKCFMSAFILSYTSFNFINT